jgi:hypothetical protein
LILHIEDHAGIHGIIGATFRDSTHGKTDIISIQCMAKGKDLAEKASLLERNQSLLMLEKFIFEIELFPSLSDKVGVDLSVLCNV